MTSLAEDVLASVEHWQKQAPSEDEKIDFLTKSIADMKDPEHQNEFKDSITALCISM
ncbi:hypothetical protein HYDPIDRAFT_119410 [Hydnomerulius pinastri MD-312]|uniref:Uncharacterized protein n=1 Tax=Hydnomerulius pinastri MD-312 TaxID=994086 RepID=A0A0C9VYW7_9AGAM|nr:hypothetical protein HYDPIDRAFT_119410 [Hydnomerulius pinastri MD-312]